MQIFQITKHLNGKILPLIMKEISGFEGQKYATIATRSSQSVGNGLGHLHGNHVSTNFSAYEATSTSVCRGPTVIRLIMINNGNKGVPTDWFFALLFCPLFFSSFLPSFFALLFCLHQQQKYKVGPLCGASFHTFHAV